MHSDLRVGWSYLINQIYVIDGDTVSAVFADDLAGWEQRRIRLHGIDAPELAQPYGPESASILANMMATSQPIFAYVTENSDRYGRVVAVLHRGDPNDSLNAALVREGLAFSYWTQDYRREEQDAKQARAGVWQQRNGGVRPWQWRKGTGRNDSSGCAPGCGFAAGILCAILLLIFFAAVGTITLSAV